MHLPRPVPNTTSGCWSTFNRRPPNRIPQTSHHLDHINNSSPPPQTPPAVPRLGNALTDCPQLHPPQSLGFSRPWCPLHPVVFPLPCPLLARLCRLPSPTSSRSPILRRAPSQPVLCRAEDHKYIAAWPAPSFAGLLSSSNAWSWSRQSKRNSGKMSTPCKG